MKLENLEANNDSIKRILKYMDTLTKSSIEFAQAAVKLTFLYKETDQYPLAIQTGYHYLDLIDFDYKPLMYNALIQLVYHINDYDQAFNLINQKKEFLSSKDSYVYFEDLITLNELKDDKTAVIRNLLLFLEDDIPKEKRLWALLYLSKIYALDQNENNFMERLNACKNLALQIQDNNVYYEALYYEALFHFLNADYPFSLHFINSNFKKSNTSNELWAQLIILKLKILLQLQQYRQASILESEEEEFMQGAQISHRKEFYALCMQLYQTLNNRFSYDIYAKKLKETNEIKLPKEKKKSTKTKIIIEKEDQVIAPKIQKKESYLESTSKFDEIASLFSLLLDDTLILRDFLLKCWINLEKKAVFDEIILVYKNFNWEGFHYKKNRLYEKKFSFDEVKESLVGFVLETQKEEVILSTDNISNCIDILTHLPYENMALVAFPLFRNNEVYGAIIYTNNNTQLVDKPLNYETLRICYELINFKVNNYLQILALQENYMAQIFLTENMIQGYKQQINGYIYCSKKAQELLGVEDVINLQAIMMLISRKDLADYRILLNKLEKNEETTGEITYSLENKNIIIKEKFFKTTINGKEILYSILEDITSLIQKEESLERRIYTSVATKVKNEVALLKDLEDYISGKKFILLMINIKDFKLYNELYGFHFGDEIIKESGRYIETSYKDFNLYHLGKDQFGIVINEQNDKRIAHKIASELLTDLENHFYQINHRVRLKFSAGIIRYPANMANASPSDIYQNAKDIYLYDIHKDEGTTIAFYDKEEVKKRFNESQLITYIAEAINHNQLELTYEQVVNLKKSEVEFYIAKINLNYIIEEDLLSKVIKRQKYEYNLDKYLIHKGFFNLMQIYNKTKILPQMAFMLSQMSLEQKDLSLYIFEQQKFFKILPSNIIFIIGDYPLNIVAMENIKWMIDAGYILSTNSLKYYPEFSFDYFFYNLVENNEKRDKFINSLVTVFGENQTELVLCNVDQMSYLAKYSVYGIECYMGDVYQKNLKLENIISLLK